MTPSTRTDTPPTPPPGQYLTVRLNTPDAGSTAGPVKIAGVANDASVTDSFGTRIRLSQQALDAFMSNPVMLYNHDVHNPIGTFTRIAYEGDRLVVEGEIDEDARTPTGASIADLARKGIVKALSIRFDEFKETRGKDFTQLDADVLDEISVVTLPSNRASLFNLRSKGVHLHGAPELLDRTLPARRVADLRTPATTRAAGPLSLDILERRLRTQINKLNEEADWDEWYSLVGIYDDVVIYQEYYASRFYQVAYTVTDDGEVTLSGAPVEVLPAWTPVGSGETDTTRTSEGEEQPQDAQARLHPDDRAAIARQIADLLRPPSPAATRALDDAGIQWIQPTPTDPPADPPAEIPVEQAIERIRSALEPAPAPAGAPPLTDIRAAIQAALNTPS